MKATNDENKTTLCVFLVAVVVPLVQDWDERWLHGSADPFENITRTELVRIGTGRNRFQLTFLFSGCENIYNHLSSRMPFFSRVRQFCLTRMNNDYASHCAISFPTRWKSSRMDGEKERSFKDFRLREVMGCCWFEYFPPPTKNTLELLSRFLLPNSALTNPLESTRREQSSWTWSDFAPSDYGEISQKCNEY